MMFKSASYLLAIASLFGLMNAQQVMTQYETIANPIEGDIALPEIRKSLTSNCYGFYPRYDHGYRAEVLKF